MGLVQVNEQQRRLLPMIRMDQWVLLHDFFDSLRNLADFSLLVDCHTSLSIGYCRHFRGQKVLDLAISYSLLIAKCLNLGLVGTFLICQAGDEA